MIRVNEVYRDHYPERWRDFDRHMPGVPLHVFGFRGEVGDINRWAARYRAAASFQGLEMDAYQSADVVRGYAGLVRAVLVWSAFERYLGIIGLDQKTSDELVASFNPEELAKKINELDDDGKFYSYIRSKVTNRTLGDEMTKFVDGAPCNVTYLLSAIRHIFGHGHLTPTANAAEASRSAEICHRLCDFHLRVMSSDFARRVAEFEEMIARLPDGHAI